MNRYSFSGTGNILLKATVASTYGADSFTEGEPIAYFTNVDIGIDFSNVEKVAKTGSKNLTAESEYRPSVLRVANIKVTDSLQSLLYKKQSNLQKKRTFIKNLTSEGKVIFLPLRTDIDETDSVTDIFIYNSSGEKVTSFYYLDGAITITDITQSDGVYKVFYAVQTIATSTFSLMDTKTPYIAAEIVVKGNINGNPKGEAVITFEALKLLTNPSFDFTNEAPFIDILEFAIIENKTPSELNYYG